MSVQSILPGANEFSAVKTGASKSAEIRYPLLQCWMVWIAATGVLWALVATSIMFWL